MSDFHHLVIGGGLIGMAAAKYLAMDGESVCVFAPPEPLDHRKHDGVFASHYDQRRLVRLIGRNRIWVQAARRAMDGYRLLEQASGIDFYEPVGALHVKSSNVHERYGELAIDNARENGIDHTFYDIGDQSWRDTFPDFNFPKTHWVLHEPNPAGMIDPRAMLSAQRAVAVEHGTHVIGEMASAVDETGDHVEVTIASGDKFTGTNAIVAAGSFTNLGNLLPRAVGMQVKSEVFVLGEVSAADAARLASLPTLTYSIDHTDISDVYLTPPVRYENGRYYFKIGANTTGDRYPETLAEAQAWFRTGDSDRWLAPMADAMAELLPAVDFLSFESRRCIISRTAHQFPIIDRISPRRFVAAGGNGSSAKCADTWGYLAARLVQKDWPDDFLRAAFKDQPEQGTGLSEWITIKGNAD